MGRTNPAATKGSAVSSSCSTEQPTKRSAQHEELLTTVVESGDKTLHLNKAFVNEESWEPLLSSGKDNVLSSVQCIHFSERFFGLGVAGYNNNATTKKRIERLLQRCLIGNSAQEEDSLRLESLEEMVVKATLHSGLGISIFHPHPTSKMINRSLKVLRLQSGFTFQHSRDVTVMATAIQNHPCLQEFTLKNFSMNCQDVNNPRRRLSSRTSPQEEVTPASSKTTGSPSSILDPLIQAAATISTLKVLDLTCMMAHRPRTTSHPFVSPEALSQLLESNTRFSKLCLSKLGLGDDHLRVVRAASSNNNLRLQELVWDDNTFTKTAWKDYVLPLLASPTLCVLKAYCQARLPKDSCEALLEVLNHGEDTRSSVSSNLHTLNVNLPWEYRESVEFLLAMNRVGGMPSASAPAGSKDTTASASATSDRNVVDKLDIVKDNISALYTLIRQSPQICRHVELDQKKKQTNTVPIPSGFVSLKPATKRSGKRQRPNRRASTGAIPHLRVPTTPHVTRSFRHLDLSSPAAKFLQTPWPEPNTGKFVMPADNKDHVSPCGVDDELAAAMEETDPVDGATGTIPLAPPPEQEEDDDAYDYFSDHDDSSLPQTTAGAAATMSKPRRTKSQRLKKKRQERRRFLETMRSNKTSTSGSSNDADNDSNDVHSRRDNKRYYHRHWWDRMSQDDDNHNHDYDNDDDSSTISEHGAIQRRNELLAKERSKRRAKQRSASSSPAVIMRKQRGGARRNHPRGPRKSTNTTTTTATATTK